MGNFIETSSLGFASSVLRFTVDIMPTSNEMKSENSTGQLFSLTGQANIGDPLEFDNQVVGWIFFFSLVHGFINLLLYKKTCR